MQNDENIRRISQWLSLYIGLLFLGYCGLFLWACPSPALAAATIIECFCLTLSLVLLHAFKPKLPAFLQRLLERLKIDIAIQHFDRSVTYLKVIVLSVASLVFSWDLSACSVAAFVDEKLAAQMYAHGANSQWIGLHPAASLECLGGALTESRKYVQAERVYLAILEIRRSLGGPNSDLVAAIYADLGDLSVRKHDLKAAEQWYRRSVALGTKKGRALTGLATVLRERNCFVESKSCYEQALMTRERLLGHASKQYQDTLRGYEKLLVAMNAQPEHQQCGKH